jgi:group I intron endonuclease
VTYGVIYVATNNVTGEQYVGQTRQKFKVRVQAHKVSAKTPQFNFHKAISSFGFGVFSFEEVFYAFDKPALDYAEKQIICYLNPAYNMTKGGSGMPGPVTAKAKAKRSDDARRRWADPEWRAKTVEAIKVASQAPDFKARCSSNAKSRNLAKVRWANHQKKQPPEKNLSQSIKNSWADPLVRERRIAGLKKAFSDPQVQQRKSLASKGRVHSRPVLERIARAKYKPVYCEELQCTFLSQKHAAEYFDVRHSTITETLKRKGKVNRQYTLVRVS